MGLPTAARARKGSGEATDRLPVPDPGLRLFGAALLLFVALFMLGRLVLVHRVAGAVLAPRALLADLAMGLCLAVLARALHALHWGASAALLLLAGLLQLANMELASAMDTFVRFADLRFAARGEFLKGSLRAGFPAYTIAWLLGCALYFAALFLFEKSFPVRPRYLWAGAAALLLGVHFLSAEQADWGTSNTIYLSVSRSLPALHACPRTDPGAGPRQTGRRPASNETGVPYFRKAGGGRRNVLLVVLEGIPGVYLRQVQEYTGVQHPIRMPALSRIAEQAVVVPNFVDHNRQTIRGLYSLLSGDYCRLSLGTPKIYEYMQLDPKSRRPCLPEILADHGYATAYLQAAELAYMSKDRFMPEAGFQQVLGKDYFRYQHVPFHWGPDDKAFFEQAADFIGGLERGGRPWFVTLLTVGTHHPGAVPEQFAARFAGRREAAAAYLDEALGWFMARLQEEGILRNTLVLLTADESHGVPGQPFGRFWGLAVALAPEAFAAVNPGVFGLVDVPCSILDYLGLARRRPQRYGRRSIFRRYTTDRPLLFESCCTERKGVVHRRLDGGRVEVLASANGELFSPGYSRRLLGGEQGRRASRRLAGLQAEADSSLFDSSRKDRLYVLLKQEDVELGREQSKVLSWGQYLLLPGGTTASVELRAAVEAVRAPAAAGAPVDCVELFLVMMQENEKLPLPAVRIPALKGGQSLDLCFSFPVEEPLDRIWAYLEAESVHPSSGVSLKVERLSVETGEREAGQPFRVQRLEVKDGQK